MWAKVRGVILSKAKYNSYQRCLSQIFGGWGVRQCTLICKGFSRLRPAVPTAFPTSGQFAAEFMRDFDDARDAISAREAFEELKRPGAV